MTLTDAELDDLWKRSQSGNRIFRSATVLRLLNMIEDLKKPTPPVCPACGRPMALHSEWVCAKCGEDYYA